MVRSLVVLEEQQGSPQTRNMGVPTRRSKDPGGGAILAIPWPLQSATLAEDQITLLEIAQTHEAQANLSLVQHKR